MSAALHPSRPSHPDRALPPARRARLGALATLVALAGLFMAGCTSVPPSSGLDTLGVQVTGGAALAPAFSPARRDYRVDVQSDIAALDLTARPQRAGAPVSVTANGKSADAKTPMRVPLAVGRNEVVVTVGAADPATAGQRYTVTVDRQDIAPVVARFQKLSFTDPATGAVMPYRLYVPEGYDRTKSYPLVVFLHGGGERGDDNEKTLTANQGGTVWALPQEQARRPAFVLVPQARNVWDGGFGLTRNSENKVSLERVYTMADDVKTVRKLLTQVLAAHPAIDRKRLYATGLSQGGFGVLNWSIAHPGLFAAVVAVSGGADPATVGVLKDKPVWLFHAEADPVIPVSHSRQAVAALKAAGGTPRYTEYSQDTYFYPMAHFAWVPAFKDASMREWLFAQTLR